MLRNVKGWFLGKKSEENNAGHGGTSSHRSDAGSSRRQDADPDGRRNAIQTNQTRSHIQNGARTLHQSYLGGPSQSQTGIEVLTQSGHQAQSKTEGRSQGRKGDDHTQARTYGEPQSDQTKARTQTQTRMAGQAQTQLAIQSQGHAIERLGTQTGDRIRAERDDETRSQAGDDTHSPTWHSVHSQIGDEIDSQITSQKQRPKWDKTETKDSPPGEEHEPPQDEPSSVVEVEAAKEGDSKFVTGPTRLAYGEPQSDKTKARTQTQTRTPDQGQAVEQMVTPMADRFQAERDDETQSKAGDDIHIQTSHNIQSQIGDEIDSIISQRQSPKWDKTETKDSPPGEEHELPKDESSSVVGVEAAKEGDSNPVTGPSRLGRIMNLLSGTKFKKSIGHRDGGSSQQPETEKDIQTEEYLGLTSIEDLKENDIVIAVMGPTGSGKSTFVHSASGYETAGVGDGLKSFTSDVRPVRFREQKSGRYVVLVDTPGFDDTYKSDLDILNMISNWLSSSYKKDKLLSAILYMHRITDNRVAGTSLKNLRVFRELCGDDALQKVYFTTTMWDEVTQDVGKRRLEELKSVYWKNLISHGAQVFCCLETSSPKELVQRIVDQAEDSRKALLLQEEMVELQKEIKETAAGRELYSQLEAIVQNQTEAIQRLNKARVGAEDPQLLSELGAQLAELREQMDEKILDMEKLKLPRMKRFLSKIQDPSKAFRSLFSSLR
ncbi:hypothetical protein JVU11DRAFT_7621 [Chiua virens]|nr:hypothetical protein JVU11DRAFT_7621 [Chiua virens]